MLKSSKLLFFDKDLGNSLKLFYFDKSLYSFKRYCLTPSNFLVLCYLTTLLLFPLNSVILIPSEIEFGSFKA